MRYTIFALLTGLVTVLVAPLQAADPARPNIIVVMADDMGWSDIGCYGGEIRTPHVDSLARDGMRFTQFYNNAVCGPTRASLLTGLYCQQVGHRGDRWNEPKDFKKCVTIAEVLQSAGYRTMMVGKWQGRDSALDRGFDRFYGPMCQGKVSYFHEVALNPFFLNRKRWQLPKDFYMTSAFNDHAEGFLNEAVRGESPFFLYVAHLAPHWPLHAREADVVPYRKQYLERGWDEWRTLRHERQRKSGIVPAGWKLSPRPPSVRDWKTDRYKKWQAERMAVYAAQVEAIDRGLGRILKIVEQSGKKDNTLVMFLSDNGAAPNGGLAPTNSGFGFGPNAKNDQWRTDGVPIRPGSRPDLPPGPHDTFAAYGLAWANVSNTPLRGTKLDGFEGGINTPLVVRWLDASGTKYPTDFKGRKPLPMEGKSLLPVFQGRKRKGHEVLYWSVPRHHVIRMEKWKAIKPKTARSGSCSTSTRMARKPLTSQSESPIAFKQWPPGLKHGNNLSGRSERSLETITNLSLRKHVTKPTTNNDKNRSSIVSKSDRGHHSVLVFLSGIGR